MNSDDSDEVFNLKIKYRNNRWESIIKQQWQLNYFGRISYSESQKMPIFEREYLFNLLIEQKELEAKQIKDANNKRNSKNNNTNRHRRNYK